MCQQGACCTFIRLPMFLVHVVYVHGQIAFTSLFHLLHLDELLVVGTGPQCRVTSHFCCNKDTDGHDDDDDGDGNKNNVYNNIYFYLPLTKT